MSDDWVSDLIRKHQTTGLMVDTNLLLVYLVGLCDPALIPRFKRTQTFEEKDFELLQDFLKKFAKVITVPGILSEVNSLANQLQEKNKPAFYQVFKEQISLWEERYAPSKQSADHTLFAKCGLTDAAILTIAEQGLLVLTDDFRLTEYLKYRNIDYINFNHIRFVSR